MMMKDLKEVDMMGMPKRQEKKSTWHNLLQRMISKDMKSFKTFYQIRNRVRIAP